MSLNFNQSHTPNQSTPNPTTVKSVVLNTAILIIEDKIGTIGVIILIIYVVHYGWLINFSFSIHLTTAVLHAHRRPTNVPDGD